MAIISLQKLFYEEDLLLLKDSPYNQVLGTYWFYGRLHCLDSVGGVVKILCQRPELKHLRSFQLTEILNVSFIGPEFLLYDFNTVSHCIKLQLSISDWTVIIYYTVLYTESISYTNSRSDGTNQLLREIFFRVSYYKNWFNITLNIERECCNASFF
jgi:hypothetical protein